MFGQRLSSVTLWCIAIGSATALAYSPSLSLSFVGDDFNLVHIARTYSLAKLFSIEINNYYRPLLFLSYGLDYALWGNSPAGYHATNVALHVINTVLVCLLAQRLLEEVDHGPPASITPGQAATTDHKSGSPGAWIFVGLLFGLTPIHATSVFWAYGRTDLLCASFYFLSILSYVKSLDRHSHRHLAVSVIAFVAALLTKEMAGSLPLLCFGLGAWILREPNRRRLALTRALKASWIYFLILGGYFTFRVLLFGHFPESPVHRLATTSHMLVNFGRYLIALIIPVDPNPLKPFFRSHPDVLLAAASLTLIAVSVGLWRTRSKSSVVLSSILIGVTLLPVLAVFGPWQLYIPSVGLALALGSFMCTLWQNRKTVAYRVGFVGIILVNLIGMAQLATITRVADGLSRQIVHTLVSQIPREGRVAIINLPSDYRGTPVFGWPGNLAYALRLNDHPLRIEVLSSVRLIDPGDSAVVEVNATKNEIAVSLFGGKNAFQIYRPEILSWRTRPIVGDVYRTDRHKMTITSVGSHGLPESIRLQVDPAIISGEVPLLVFSEGHLRPAPGDL